MSEPPARDDDGSLWEQPWLWAGAGAVVVAVVVVGLLASGGNSGREAVFEGNLDVCAPGTASCDHDVETAATPSSTTRRAAAPAPRSARATLRCARARAAAPAAWRPAAAINRTSAPPRASTPAATPFIAAAARSHVQQPRTREPCATAATAARNAWAGTRTATTRSRTAARPTSSPASTTATPACPERAHAVRTCAAGACGYRCQNGYADCNREPGDGCEVNTNDDKDNCGGCATLGENQVYTGLQGCCAGECRLLSLCN